MVEGIADALTFLALWTVGSLPLAMALGRFIRLCDESDAEQGGIVVPFQVQGLATPMLAVAAVRAAA